VLLALIRLGDEAYGVPIADAIAESSGREVAQGSVYITLDRLSRKGFVTSRMLQVLWPVALIAMPVMTISPLSFVLICVPVSFLLGGLMGSSRPAARSVV
jgi:PadR family transcriptional regulator